MLYRYHVVALMLTSSRTHWCTSFRVAWAGLCIIAQCGFSARTYKPCVTRGLFGLSFFPFTFIEKLRRNSLFVIIRLCWSTEWYWQCNAYDSVLMIEWNYYHWKFIFSIKSSTSVSVRKYLPACVGIFLCTYLKTVSKQGHSLYFGWMCDMCTIQWGNGWWQRKLDLKQEFLFWKMSVRRIKTLKMICKCLVWGVVVFHMQLSFQLTNFVAPFAFFTPPTKWIIPRMGYKEWKRI